MRVHGAADGRARFGQSVRFWQVAAILILLAPAGPVWSQSAVWQPQGATTGNIYYNGGNVGIGTSSPAVKFHVAGGGLSVSGPAAGLTVAPDANSSASLVLASQNSQTYGASVMYLLSGNNGGFPQTNAGLGYLSFRNLYWAEGASIAAYAAQTHTTSSTAGFLAFSTTPIGSTAGSERMRIDQNGNVGIGTTNPQYKLSVNGTIGTKEVIVTANGWADYVFQPGYRLQPLNQVSSYIREHHHLPGIPSEAEVKANGVGVADMQRKLLAKVEELTLYTIQAEERNAELERKNHELRTELNGRTVESEERERRLEQRNRTLEEQIGRLERAVDAIRTAADKSFR